MSTDPADFRRAGAHRLLKEASPYLNQHADNPVEWYPWCPEAFRRAKEENKPVLLSVGYAACHWCHVMAHESFEDEETASLMNRNFINIKVDREERPDIDMIYQQAVQMMGVSGGWPLTVFVTPEGKPFFGGTYFPPEERLGRPSFRSVLKAVIDTYRNRRQVIENNSGFIMDFLSKELRRDNANSKPGIDTLRKSASFLLSQFDPTYGGFGHCPKFPQPSALSYLLRYFKASGEIWYRNAVLLALKGMAQGGIYDQIGGGFHRYSTDERWLVPHFEKMLYDNALLVPLYLDAHTITGDAAFKTVAIETIEYMKRDLLAPEGGFYSSQDADSNGEEGAYYLWTHDEIITALGAEKGKAACSYFGVTETGTFDGGDNILHIAGKEENISKSLGISAKDWERLRHDIRHALLRTREKRPRPFKDEKVLTGLNGLAISAFVRASEVLDSPTFRRDAENTAEFILSHCFRNGRLLRYWAKGQGRQEGFIEDYAFFVNGLLDLWEAGSERRYLDLAILLAEKMNDLFGSGDGGYFFTSSDHDTLIHRPLSIYDQALPSGSGAAVTSLLRLHSLTDHTPYRDFAEKTFQRFHAHMEENPLAFASLLGALDFSVRGPTRIVIAGDEGNIQTRRLLRSVHQSYVPNRILFLYDAADGMNIPPGLRSILTNPKQIERQPTAYVCTNSTCSPPLTDANALLDLLK